MSERAVLSARLQAAGCVFAEDEAELLLAAATGPELETLVARRLSGVPLEQVVGWAAFDGLRIVLTPDVFVPRRRSELLVAAVVERAAARVLDLCCGSGAVGAAVAARLPEAEVWAADIDPVAVACARQNLPPERVLEGDLYDPLPVGMRGTLDAIVVNAPYVPTGAIAGMPREARDHEPRVALDGGRDGLALHRRVFAEARPWLADGGAIVIETSRAQAAHTLGIAAEAGFVARVVTDDDLDATAVVAASPR